MIESKILKLLYGGVTTAAEFCYDQLAAPPLLSLLTIYDIEQLRLTAMDIKLSGNVNRKYDIIDLIMSNRGFRRLAGGTNRLVYRHLEYPAIVVKVAMDSEGMKNNPDEFRNQRIIKPFCCKVFEISPCGTVGLFERVERITSRYEFSSIATDVFDMIVNILVGKYVLEDIGTKFMYNWGIRKGFGPVLLDFPYIYELDGAKLFCKNRLEDGSFCNGEIDYDEGFNFLTCKKCGELYRARELSKPNDQMRISISSIRTKGAVKMKVTCARGEREIKSREFIDTTKIMKKPKDIKYPEKQITDPSQIRLIPITVTSRGKKRISEIKAENRDKINAALKKEKCNEVREGRFCTAKGVRVQLNENPIDESNPVQFVTSVLPENKKLGVVARRKNTEETTEIKKSSILTDDRLAFDKSKVLPITPITKEDAEILAEKILSKDEMYDNIEENNGEIEESKIENIVVEAEDEVENNIERFDERLENLLKMAMNGIDKMFDSDSGEFVILNDNVEDLDYHEETTQDQAAELSEKIPDPVCSCSDSNDTEYISEEENVSSDNNENLSDKDAKSNTLVISLPSSNSLKPSKAMQKRSPKYDKNSTYYQTKK